MENLNIHTIPKGAWQPDLKAGEAKLCYNVNNSRFELWRLNKKGTIPDVVAGIYKNQIESNEDLTRLAEMRIKYDTRR